MKRIWAPWRIEYIQGEREEGCVFCNAVAEPEELARLVVYKGKLSIVMLNKYPYIGGHLLIAPRKHVGELSDLEDREQLDLLRLTVQSVEALKRAMRPHGFNIGINIGEIAGAGIPDHIHVHVVPRWAGDTNFIPVFSEARVINEHLTKTWEKLRANWKAQKKKGTVKRRKK